MTARTPVNAAPAAPKAESAEDDASDGFDFSDDDVPEDDDVAGAGDGAAVLPLSASAARSDPRSFADVVALASEKRDAKLKFHLEDHVSLVKFDGVAGSIDLFLLPGAPAELANDLREKLNAWTTRQVGRGALERSGCTGDRRR